MTEKTESELLKLERKYCSWGDTVHYLEPPKIFERSEGSYLYDRDGHAVPRSADVVFGGRASDTATSG